FQPLDWNAVLCPRNRRRNIRLAGRILHRSPGPPPHPALEHSAVLLFGIRHGLCDVRVAIADFPLHDARGCLRRIRGRNCLAGRIIRGAKTKGDHTRYYAGVFVHRRTLDEWSELFEHYNWPFVAGHSWRPRSLALHRIVGDSSSHSASCSPSVLVRISHLAQEEGGGNAQAAQCYGAI